MLRPMVAMLTRLVDRFDTDETRIQKGQCMNAERRTNPWRPARKEKFADQASLLITIRYKIGPPRDT